jgi:hypothetical protein
MSKVEKAILALQQVERGRIVMIGSGAIYMGDDLHIIKSVDGRPGIGDPLPLVEFVELCDGLSDDAVRGMQEKAVDEIVWFPPDDCPVIAKVGQVWNKVMDSVSLSFSEFYYRIAAGPLEIAGHRFERACETLP